MIRRLCAGTAVCVVAVLLLVACGTSPAKAGPASRARTSDPTTTAGAQNLRVGIDLALGAHVMVLARTTDAAVGVRTSEFSAYGMALHADDATVASAVAPGHDTSAQDQIVAALTGFDKDVLNYTTAVYTKNTSAAQQAKTAMATTYTPQMRTALEQTTHAGASALNAGLQQQASDITTVVDAQAAGDWTTAYTSLTTAHADAVTFGTVLARAMARTSPTTYPGDPVSKAAGLRAALESELQTETYLLGMAEVAAAAGRASEQAAAAAAYAGSTSTLGQAIDPASPAISSAVTGDLTQAQTAAAGLAQATTQQNTSAITSGQQALTQTFPADYLVVAHQQLGVPKAAAHAASTAYGQALVRQAGAEGQQVSEPSASATAAAAGATLGEQLSAALVGRYPTAFSA